MLSCAGVLALSIVLFTPASSGLFHEECWSCELIEVAAGVRHAQLPSLPPACRPSRRPATLQHASSLTSPRRVAYLLWDLDNVTIRPHADLLATLLSLQALAKTAGAQQLTTTMYANPSTVKREAALLPILDEWGVHVKHVPLRPQSADLALRGDAFAALKSNPPEDTSLLLVSSDTDHAGVLSWATSLGVWTCAAAPWPAPRYAPNTPPRLEGEQLAAACCAALWLKAPKPAAAAAAARARAVRPAATGSPGEPHPTDTSAAPQAVQQRQGDTAASVCGGWMDGDVWGAWLHQQQCVEWQGGTPMKGVIGASWAAGLWINPQRLHKA